MAAVSPAAEEAAEADSISMNRLITIFRCLALLLLTGAGLSCGPVDPTVFEISYSANPVNATQEEFTVSVTCDMPWSATLEDESWASIENLPSQKGKEYSGSFTVKLSFNSSEEPRTNRISFTSGNVKIRKGFTQNGLADLLSQRKIAFVSGSQIVRFTPEMQWSATVSEGAGWLNCSPQSGIAGKEAELRVEANDNYLDVGSRSGVVAITFGGKYIVEIPVTQLQKDAILLPDAGLEAPFYGGFFTVNTAYNIEYEAVSNADWVRLIETRAMNEGAVDFLVDANPGFEPREAVIVFRGRTVDVESEFVVRQEGRDQILASRIPGVWQNDAKYVYEPLKWQIFRTKNLDDTYDFGLMDTENKLAWRVAGIPVRSLQPGDSFTVNFSLSRPGRPIKETPLECVFLEEDEGLRWFRATDGTGFIVKR